MSVPDLTIVVPAYRAEKTLARTLESIRNQRGVALEVIVVVDGVFDRTPDIARGFGGLRVEIIETQSGANEARNRGLRLANAPFVSFADADDYVEGDFYARMVEALAKNGAEMVFCPHYEEYVRPRRRAPEKDFGVYLSAGGDQDRLLAVAIEHGVLTGAIGWRTERLRGIGGWNPASIRGEDSEVVVRALLAGFAFAVAGAGGHYVHVNHPGEHRITRARVAPTIPSYRMYLDRAEERAATSPSGDKIRRAAALNYYWLARACFAEGSDEPARQMLAEARRLGLQGHPGTLAHRIGSSLLGMRATIRLRRRVLGVKRSLRGLQATIVGDRTGSP